MCFLITYIKRFKVNQNNRNNKNNNKQYNPIFNHRKFRCNKQKKYHKYKSYMNKFKVKLYNHYKQQNNNHNNLYKQHIKNPN